MGILGAGGFVLLPAGGGFARLSARFVRQQGSPVLQPFVDPLPVYSSLSELTEVPQFPAADRAAYTAPYFGAATRCFEIAARERFVKFHRDLPETAAWTYVDANNATSAALPQVITVRLPKVILGQPAGAGFLVRHLNELAAGPRDFGLPVLAPHLHGGHHPAPADGFPADIVNRPADFPAHIVIAPGEHGDFMYPLRDVGFTLGQPLAEERTSYLWFHDHVLDFTGPNVYRGLANVLPVFDDLDTGDENDPSPTALRLPSAPFDLPMVLQDKIFDASGALVFDPFNQDGFLGDTYVVNGVVQPFHHVKRRKYRLRFLNGSNARIYEIFLTNDVGQTFPMTQIATEGGLLSRPIRNVQSFTLPMAQRFEFVVDFSDPVFSGQTAIYIENRMAQTNGRKPDGVVGQGPKLVKFIIDNGAATDNSRVPDVLRPFAPISQAELAQATRRSFKWDRSHGLFTVNGQPVDLEKSLAASKNNTPEIWHLENSSGGWWHPIHIHSELMRVLRRNGAAPPLNETDGVARRDTVLLRGGESVDVFLKFRDYDGPFVFHCHNIEHEDMAMMGRFDMAD
jgi:FtsP/CotA-like multicopper oxidase with cupredoxin domain